MTKQIVQFKNKKKEKIFIEAEITTGTQLVSVGKNVVAAAVSLEKSLDPVIHLASNLIGKISELKINKPAEVEIQLGLKLNGALDFWIISCDGEGSLNVILKWVNK